MLCSGCPQLFAFKRPMMTVDHQRPCMQGTQQALTHALLETIRWAVSEEEEKNSPSGGAAWEIFAAWQLVAR